MTDPVGPPVSCVILYVKDVGKIAAFYERFFGMVRLPGESQGWIQRERSGRQFHLNIQPRHAALRCCKVMRDLPWSPSEIEAWREAASKLMNTITIDTRCSRWFLPTCFEWDECMSPTYRA